MRIALATTAALALIAGVVVLGATLWPEAIDDNGVHGWRPWVDDGIIGAWVVAVGGFGTALARGIERPASRVLRYLSVAVGASLVALVVTVVGGARDNTESVGCNPTDAGAAAGVGNCDFWGWFLDVAFAAGVLVLSIVAFAVVGMTAASTQKAWQRQREYRRRYG